MTKRIVDVSEREQQERDERRQTIGAMVALTVIGAVLYLFADGYLAYDNQRGIFYTPKLIKSCQKHLKKSPVCGILSHIQSKRR